MRTLLTVALTAVLSMSSNALAHDQTMHKANATHGKMVALRGEQLTLATDDGPVAVMLTGATKVERDTKAVGREALTSGTHIAVIGTRVPGQGLIAKEIVLGDDDSAQGHDSEDPGSPTGTRH